MDDVLFFVKGALSSPSFPSVPASVVRGVVLEAACSWREIRVRTAKTDEPRALFVCDVVHRGFRREFLGYNRARSAVLEATILATRTRILPIDEILAEYRRLQVIVDKTAGPAEREAMAILTEFVQAEAAALKASAAVSDAAGRLRRGPGTAAHGADRPARRFRPAVRRDRRRARSAFSADRGPTRAALVGGGRGQRAPASLRPQRAGAPRDPRGRVVPRPSRDPRPRRARLRHPARPRNRARVVRTVRPPHRGGDAGRSHRPRAPIVHRHLGVRVRRLPARGRAPRFLRWARAAAGPARHARRLALRRGRARRARRGFPARPRTTPSETCRPLRPSWWGASRTSS